MVPVFVSKCTLWHQKKTKKSDFQNAVIPQPVGGFLFSTPEMKARDAYVPFLLSKPLNKNENKYRIHLEIYIEKNINGDYIENIYCLIFFGIHVPKYFRYPFYLVV